jgi:hypothetical protein
MGANQSSEIKQVTDISNKAVTNIVNTTKVSASAQQSGKNTFSVSLGENSEINCDTINWGQKIVSSQKLKVFSKVSNTSELTTILKSSIDNAMSQNNTAVNGFLSTAFNNQESSQDIKNILKNTIENNITNENVTECNAVIDNANKGELVLKKGAKITCKEFNSPQEIQTQQVVECFSDALQAALLNNSNIADAVNKLEQSQTSENRGADDFAKAFTGPLMWVAIAFVVAVVIFIPLFLFVFKIKNKKRYYF